MKLKLILPSLILLALLLLTLLFFLRRPIDSRRLTKNDCKCRIISNKKVVGGKSTNNRIPWFVSLTDEKLPKENTICGGVLINKYSIITSASCLHDYQKQDDIDRLRIRIGIQKLNEQDITEKTYFVKTIHRVKHYVANPKDDGDFALIVLNKTINFNQDISPACLTTEFEEYDDIKLTFVGFGGTDTVRVSPKGKPLEFIRFSNELKEAETNYQKIDSENDQYCHDHLICAKATKKDFNTNSLCFGDLGGPLMITRNGKTEIVGIGQYIGIEYSEYWKTWNACLGTDVFARMSSNIKTLEKWIGDDYCTI